MKTDKEIKSEANDIAEEFAISINDKCLQIAQEIPETEGTLLQRKMMAALLLEGSEAWTVTRLCNVAGCSRNEWYRVTQTPAFGEKMAKLQKQTKGVYIPAVFRAFIKKALYGDKDGLGNSGNQQAFLRDVGVFSVESSGNSGPINVQITVVQEGKEQLEQNRRLAIDRLRYADQN